MRLFIMLLSTILLTGSCEYIENIINPPTKIEYVMITPTPAPTEVPVVEEVEPPYDGLVYETSFDENQTTWKEEYGSFYKSDNKLVAINDENTSFSLFTSPYYIENGSVSLEISFPNEHTTDTGGVYFRGTGEGGYLLDLSNKGRLQLSVFTITPPAEDNNQSPLLEENSTNVADSETETTDEVIDDLNTDLVKQSIVQRDVSRYGENNITITLEFRDRYLGCYVQGEELFVESITEGGGEIGLYGDWNSTVLFDDLVFYDYDEADSTTCGYLADKNEALISVPVYAYTKYENRIFRIGSTKSDKDGYFCFNLPAGKEYFFTTEEADPMEGDDIVLSGTIVDLNSTDPANIINLDLAKIRDFNGTINAVFVPDEGNTTRVSTDLVESEMAEDEYLFYADLTWQKVANAYDNGNKREEFYINPAMSKVGLWTTWYENGRPEKEVYFDTPKGELVMHGPYREWFESGVEKVSGFYRDNMKTGYWQEWDDKGRIRFEGHYKNGNKVGLWIVYEDWFSDFLTERLWLQKGEYSEKGKKDGEWRYRDKDNLMDGTEKVEIYKNGKLIEEKIEKVGEGIEIDEGMS